VEGVRRTGFHRSDDRSIDGRDADDRPDDGRDADVRPDDDR